MEKRRAKVYPVGYSLYGSESYVERLMSDPNSRLIDTRLVPYSWRPEWRSDALQAKYGERYRQGGNFLGNLSLCADGNPEISHQNLFQIAPILNI